METTKVQSDAESSAIFVGDVWVSRSIVFQLLYLRVAVVRVHAEYTFTYSTVQVVTTTPHRHTDAGQTLYKLYY